MSAQFNFSGKNVFVVGGTSGINLGIACGFARWGAKVAVASRKQDKVDAAVENLKNNRDRLNDNSVAGIVTGLAWTHVGGDILFIESSLSKGKGKLTVTGNLGNVMKESMHVAKTLSWSLITENRRKTLKTKWKTNGQEGIHVHCPEGGIPKDGPSAGAAITTALYSLLSGLCQ